MIERFFISTAISYPNGEPHLGHAYELIAADAIARFMRLSDKNVLFVTGTDEHGLKMVQTAEREGLSPKALANRNSERFRAMGQALNSSNDDFIRTTEPRHYEACKVIWEKMVESGDIYLAKYSGWYSVRDEAFFDEDELSLGDENKNGEIKRIAPSGAPVEWVEEESYFFRLSKYQEPLLKHYSENPDFIGPDTRRNEIVSFAERGLKDLSISRKNFSWGVPVPNDPSHVMYVWVDALTNYLTACGYPDEKADRSSFWPADLHLIGKDIVRFHAIYWPAFLLSANLPLPKRVFCHGFLNNRGEKMSKSLGNVVEPIAMSQKYGVDAFRYFFLREISFGQDGSYSNEAIVGRLNADLANDLGNLAQRSLSFVAKNCEGRVPERNAFSSTDNAILKLGYSLLAEAESAMQDLALHLVLVAIWKLVGEANRYFANEAPWVLRKNDIPRMQQVLWVTLESLRIVGILSQPFIPQAAEKLLDLLAVPNDRRNFSFANERFSLDSGVALPEPSALFPRYLEVEGEGETQPSPTKPPKEKKL